MYLFETNKVVKMIYLINLIVVWVFKTLRKLKQKITFSPNVLKNQYSIKSWNNLQFEYDFR